MNDNFVEQIVAAAQAAIDKCSPRSASPIATRVAVGGHSYGAFMTANLLAHTDLFRAGIARSGAYNRTLTPFGFQCERRTFWEAPQLYLRMSPFTYANKINEPILLIHGEADNNPGTFPIQSERLFQASAAMAARRARDAAVRSARLPGARVGARHARGNVRVGGPLGQEPPGGPPRALIRRVYSRPGPPGPDSDGDRSRHLEPVVLFPSRETFCPTPAPREVKAMIEIRRILCPTDLSDVAAQRVRAGAGARSAMQGAEVELAHVHEMLLPGPAGPATYPPWATSVPRHLRGASPVGAG